MKVPNPQINVDNAIEHKATLKWNHHQFIKENGDSNSKPSTRHSSQCQQENVVGKTVSQKKFKYELISSHTGRKFWIEKSQLITWF